MHRRGGPPRPESPSPGIELSELPPWSGDKSTVRSSGYTPPSLFAVPSDRGNGDPDHLFVSSVTDSLAPTSPTSPTSPRRPTEPYDDDDTAAIRRNNSAPPSPQVDVITAQIQRALGVSASSETTDPDDPHNSLRTSNSLSAAATHWHDQEAGFRALLGANTVDVDELRRLVWAAGVPERPWMRDLAWKLLCGLLPPDRCDWEAELAARRAEYWSYVSDCSIEPSIHAPPGDHPLCSENGSRWKEHFADLTLRESIVRDAERALPEVRSFAPLRDALARLLFVHSKTTPNARYKQGMHELAAPFLSVFSAVPFVDLGDAEADAYFCYDYIMKEMAMLYASNEGLEVQLCELQALLRIKDPGLEKHLSDIGVDPRFFGLRWLRLWLAHEFEYGDMLKIWDSLLTAEKALPWLRYVATAMLIRIRDQLLAADFAGAMKLLLRYEKCDITKLLQIADRLRTSNVVIVRSAAR